MRAFTEEQQMFRVPTEIPETEVQPHMPCFSRAGHRRPEIFAKAGDQGFR